MGTSISEEKHQEAIRFHGHSCPGLAIGMRAVEMAAAAFGSTPDKSFTAIAETDKCPSDGVQFLSGCTFGNGKLTLENRNNMAFSFFRQGDEKGKRISRNPDFSMGNDDRLMKLKKKMAEGELTAEEDKLFKELMSVQIKQVMDADLDSLFIVEEIDRKDTV